ncbi:hypothetical protein DFH09DRAFT_1421739 [Mycena vulgaris]|nr:hypothetical protein DFH09DRAFT_1421739 [Mycena vulgaris]
MRLLFRKIIAIPPLISDLNTDASIGARASLGALSISASRMIEDFFSGRHSSKRSGISGSRMTDCREDFFSDTDPLLAQPGMSWGLVRALKLELPQADWKYNGMQDIIDADPEPKIHSHATAIKWPRFTLCSSAVGTATTPLSFAAADWIWTPTTTADAHVGLRKDFTPPLGKALIAAEIIITAVNELQLYVNGDFIVSGTPPTRARFSPRYCVDLLPSSNVFAVNATTPGANGGLIATIHLTYSDNSTDTIVTNGSWRVRSLPPAGFGQLSFDDTAWASATVLDAYDTGPLWSTVHPNIASDPPDVSLFVIDWIWTNVVPASGRVPPGSRAFRRTFTPAPGQTPMTANIVITANNAYTMYVNGVPIGNGSNPAVAQHYIVDFQPGTAEVVIAILATNTGTAASTAGILLFMEVNMVPSGRVGCTAGAFILTDDAWKSTTGAIPAGFEEPGFDDSAWAAFVVQEAEGGARFGTVTIAAAAPAVTV